MTTSAVIINKWGKTILWDFPLQASIFFANISVNYLPIYDVNYLSKSPVINTIVLTACEAHGRETVLVAMRHCQELELYSANDLRGAIEMISAQMPPLAQPTRLPVEDERYHIPVQKRDLSVYAEVASGSGVAQ